MVKVFESPDHGQTVYAREFGKLERTLIKENNALHEKLAEDKMWGEIRRMGRTNPTMQAELERVIMLYNLLKDDGQTTHIK